MKKIVRLNEEGLKALVEEKLNEILNDKETNQTNNMPSPHLVDITDKAEMEQYRDEVYYIMFKSYEDKGGIKGFKDSQSLFRNANVLTLYTDGIHIYAAAIYSDRLRGSKMILIGGINPFDRDKGRTGVEEIIKHDIENFKGWYWCEASEGIEYLFKKNNGYPIPSEYVKNYLLKGKRIEIIDEFHYQRIIGDENEIFTKVVFGFNSKEMMDTIYRDIDDYNELRYAFNQTEMKNESINDEQRRAWELALTASDVINTVYEDSIERCIYDLTPTQKQYIEYSIDLLKPFLGEPKVQQNIELGEYMLKTYPLLEAHPF